MSTLKRAVLDQLNHVLATCNLRLDSLTAIRQEERRLVEADRRGDFGSAVYPIPDCFRTAQSAGVFADLPKYRSRFESFRDSSLNTVGFQYANGFFTSPDAEVLYTLVRSTRPRQILEVGCGNSTKIIRQAIIDGGFDCRHRCIDPNPRAEISKLANTVFQVQIQSLKPAELIRDLTNGDIVFIDTSHEVKPANDVAYIYGRLLPFLPCGVLVHVHDIFLPYEYPVGWVRDQGLAWGEQYLVQTMLMNSEQWEVLWPGYYLQRTLAEFSSYFPHTHVGLAQSMWLRKLNGKSPRHE
jgi:predicted O-methyltransferase YrrM